MANNNQQGNQNQNYQQQPSQNQQYQNQTRGNRSKNQMGAKDFLSEHTSLDITRPANSLKNWFIGIPIALSLVFGVVVEGNPVSKFVSSLGVGARRGVGSAITETQPQMQQGVENLYGRPTQPGDLNRRNNGQTQNSTQCNSGWCWKN